MHFKLNDIILVRRRTESFITSVLLLTGHMISVLAVAQNDYPLVRTPQNVSINYQIPKGALASNEPLTAVFSAEPTDEEIFRAHFFEEPLVTMEGSYSAKENQALVYALAVYSQHAVPDDLSAITGFLKEYPQSRWRGALLTDLGLVYRRYGYFTKATACFNEAWDLMRQSREPKVNLLANRALAEVICIYSWLSDADKIEALHKQIKAPESHGRTPHSLEPSGSPRSHSRETRPAPIPASPSTP